MKIKKSLGLRAELSERGKAENGNIKEGGRV
jgi:hypothetical protein